MKRTFALVVALVLGLGTAALAQANTPEIEIVDINASRYADGGETTMVIEFRNLTAAPDPSLLGITVNGEPVSDVEIVPLGETSLPVGVVLVIDASGSMAGDPLDAAKTAAKNFVAQKRTEDSIALVTFADEVTVQTGFTRNTSDLQNRIDSIEAAGETAFADGVIKGIQLFDSLSARDLLPNLVILTDGEDTVSVASLEDALAVIDSSSVRVFGVALESPDFNPSPVEQIATAGSGLFLSTPDPEQLSLLYGEINREIRNTLVARFVSPISTPGDVEFAVSYPGGLSSGQTFAVSGFATTTTAAPTTIVVTTHPAPATSISRPSAALPTRTLAIMAAGGLGLTGFLFLVILFGRDEDDAGSRFARRLQAYGRSGRSVEVEKKPLLEKIPLLNRFSQAAEEEVKKRGLLSGVNGTLEQANISMSAGEAILGMLGLAVVLGVFFAIFQGPLVGLIVFFVSLVLFVFLIKYAGTREKSRFEKQLPDTLTLLSTSLRAGYSLLQAIEAVASEAPNPTAREFNRAVVEARLGLAVPQSLDGIVDRTKSEDFEWAVMAIEIQREVGGNLAEVLQTVADTMMARNRLKGEIRALTAEGRISAIVLGSLPFGLGLFLWFSNREYLLPLVESTLGRIAILMGLLLMSAGAFWLKKIVDIKI